MQLFWLLVAVGTHLHHSHVKDQKGEQTDDDDTLTQVAQGDPLAVEMFERTQASQLEGNFVSNHKHAVEITPAPTAAPTLMYDPSNEQYGAGEGALIYDNYQPFVEVIIFSIL